MGFGLVSDTLAHKVKPTELSRLIGDIRPCRYIVRHDFGTSAER